MTEHLTEYGTVKVRDGSVVVSATQAQLYAWAHRAGAAWPCSTLDDYDTVAAYFADTGLVDLSTVIDDNEVESDIDGSELSAWSSDVLRDILPPTHPAWYVTVGQFLGTCQWFAYCENDATHIESHVVLGGVPCCDRCAKIGK